MGKGKIGWFGFRGPSYKFIKRSEALLHRENSYYKRLALEHIEIIRHLNNDNLNVLNRFIPDEGLIELVYEYDSHCDDSLVRYPSYIHYMENKLRRILTVDDTRYGGKI